MSPLPVRNPIRKNNRHQNVRVVLITMFIGPLYYMFKAHVQYNCMSILYVYTVRFRRHVHHLHNIIRV